MDGGDVARMLLKINAVKFNVENPFTYASGIKSPIYTDCRLLMSHPAERSRVIELMKSVVGREVGAASVDVIAGTASAGIPHAAWLAQALDKPMVYVPKKSKDHGLGKAVEGVSPGGRRVLLVEDLVSTGGSSIGAVNTLRGAGATVEHCVAVFTYGLPEAVDAFKAAGVVLHALTDFDSALKEAVAAGYLTGKQASKALEWRSDPRGWFDKK